MVPLRGLFPLYAGVFWPEILFGFRVLNRPLFPRAFYFAVRRCLFSVSTYFFSLVVFSAIGLISDVCVLCVYFL